MSKNKTKVVAVKDGKRIVVDADFDEKEAPEWFKELLSDSEPENENATE